MFKNLIDKISNSLKDRHGHTSHTRISSYIILISIILSSLLFIGIDVVNGIMSWTKGDLYEIPTSHITIFGMILGHHLFLLGIKRASENRQNKYDSQHDLEEIERKKILKSKEEEKER